MGRQFNWLHPAMAGLLPALACAGAIWAAGPTALGFAYAGAASVLVGAGAFLRLARLKLNAGGEIDADSTLGAAWAVDEG